MSKRTALAASMVIFVMVKAPVIAGQTGSTERPASTAHAGSCGGWPRVHVPDGSSAELVRRGLDEAARLLADARCQTLLTEFHTPEGRPLVDTLQKLGVDLREYLCLILFRDGSQHSICENALAYTSPGSRVVFICARQLERHWREKRDYEVGFSFIHEVLHTLGLSEDPPTTAAITRRVRSRCWAV